MPTIRNVLEKRKLSPREDKALLCLGVCLVLFAGLAVGAKAQEELDFTTGNLPEGFVIHDSVDLGLRQLYLMVTDRKGRRITGLQRDDFTLEDNGQEQELITFEGGDIPFTALLLLDGSTSMKGGRLEISLAGARSFIAGMREHDEARILVYSDRILDAGEWQGPQDASTPNVQATGGTALLDHVFLGLRILAERHGRRVLVLLSDGWDLQSVLDVDQVAAAVQRSEAILYWIRPANEEASIRMARPGETPRILPVTSWRGKQELTETWETLDNLVERSGGRVVLVDRPENVDAALQEVLQELREQYAIGYYPQGLRQDGSWRSVEVSADRPGARVRARKGYIDE